MLCATRSRQSAGSAKDQVAGITSWGTRRPHGDKLPSDDRRRPPPGRGRSRTRLAFRDRGETVNFSLPGCGVAPRPGRRGLCRHHRTAPAVRPAGRWCIMVDITRQQILACQRRVVLCDCELYNVVSFASGKTSKNKRDRVRTAQYLLSAVPKLNILRDDYFAGLSKIRSYSSATLRLRFAAALPPPGMIGLQIRPAISFCRSEHAGHQIRDIRGQIMVPSMPPPSPQTVDFTKLCHEILHSGGQRPHR